MDMTDKKTVLSVLAAHDLKPKKQLGQNFLVSRTILEHIIESAQISPDDSILEIGPGLGALTAALAAKAKTVVAVEKDTRLCEILNNTLREHRNISIIPGDILRLSPLPFTSDTAPYRVIANIPYYLTGRLIRSLVSSENPPRDIVLMVQKEVAHRIVSIPPDMNLLGVSVQYYGAARILKTVPRSAFWPVPEVDSAVIYINLEKRTKNIAEEKRFFLVAKAGFSQPRKLLRSNLKKHLSIDESALTSSFASCGIPEQARAQDVSMEQWRCLASHFEV